MEGNRQSNQSQTTNQQGSVEPAAPVTTNNTSTLGEPIISRRIDAMGETRLMPKNSMNKLLIIGIVIFLISLAALVYYLLKNSVLIE